MENVLLLPSNLSAKLHRYSWHRCCSRVVPLEGTVACYPTQGQLVWLIFGGVATKDMPRFLGITSRSPSPHCRAMTPSTSPNMETPTAFEHSIRFSVPAHQGSTFDHAIASLPPAFLGLPTTREVFESTAACPLTLEDPAT
jgi:hypothetical protein